MDVENAAMTLCAALETALGRLTESLMAIEKRNDTFDFSKSQRMPGASRMDRTSESQLNVLGNFDQLNKHGARPEVLAA